MSDTEGTNISISADRLRSIIERVERLNEEKKEISESIKDIMSEAKSAGFDVKTIREIIRIRATDQAEREEREQLRDLYLQALGLY